MLIFYGSMIIGLLAIVCAYFGLLYQFILVFVVSLLGQFIYKVLTEKLIKSEQQAAINEATQKLLNDLSKAQKEDWAKKQKIANNTDFIEEGMIPIRVDENTGAYVVDIKDIIIGTERYLDKMEKELMKRFTDLGDMEVQEKPKDK